MDAKQFTDSMARELGVTREEVSALTEALAGVMADASAQMDAVSVAGFGTFEPRKRLERITVQPSTGKRLLVPPKLLLAFRPSSLLKQRVKG